MDGREKGLAEGIVKGKIEGKLEAKLEAAKNLLDVLDVEIITKKLGLTIDQVEALKNNKVSEKAVKYSAKKRNKRNVK